MKSAMFAIVGAVLGLWIGSACALVCLMGVADSYYHAGPRPLSSRDAATIVYLLCLVPPSLLGGPVGYLLGRNRPR